MANFTFVTSWKPWLLLLTVAGLARAEDLPLPAPGPLPGNGDSGLLKPTVTIRPPSAAPKTATQPKDARAEAIEEMERQVLAAQAAKEGNTVALRQLIVMQGPVDTKVFSSRKPPPAIEGKVAIIGLKHDDAVVKNLEQFFGVPMTTEREKQLLETVKTQMAGVNPSGMDVKVAGWWPKEGVMAVALVPHVTGS